MWLTRILLLFVLSSAPALGETLASASVARVAIGLAPLQQDSVLQRAAQLQANFMAARARIGHDGPGGASLSDRARAVGHRPCHLAENVAGGQSSGAEVIRAWLYSPGHRANILNPRLDSAALATARGRDGRLYWAMVLAGDC